MGCFVMTRARSPPCRAPLLWPVRRSPQGCMWRVLFSEERCKCEVRWAAANVQKVYILYDPLFLDTRHSPQGWMWRVLFLEERCKCEVRWGCGERPKSVYFI